MAEVDIGNETYQAFADLDAANLYLGADATLAAAWSLLSDDGKGRSLVTGTRIFLRQSWKDGTPSLDAPPQAVADACCEFAGAIAAGYDLGTAPASVLPVRRQKAGPVEVEYFRDFDNPLYVPPPLPQAVWDLIKPLLLVADGMPLPGSIATGCEGSRIRDFEWWDGSPHYIGLGGIGDRDWN